MAIEISPRIRIKVPIWTIIVGGVLLILVISFTVAYIYFAFSLKKISQELEESSKVVIPLEKTIAEKEAELEPISQKINDFNVLLLAHKKTLDIFTFLERTCLPKAWFHSFNLDSGTGEVTLSGEVNSFVTLDQQINVLRQEPALISADISNISIGEEGKISFDLSLIFR